ncbi:MAG TPA: dCMP deaminase family protein [Deltaproteobacteria bacterium]|nr:dCMP deaminase family protein [Deltaproteobacteria bacterium]HPR54393.1 dCMP deaminase family protein [Deltaproteobacteria bacterium]HXK46278.1 dCMP deaminase family protein [Deltaproteobacteria bacterium]
MNQKRPSWDEYFMMLAKLAASRSTCLSRPTGAVVVKDKQVVTTGYNGSLPGQAHCMDEGVCFRRSLEWPEAMKYDMCRSAHAEANAIALAAKKGVSLEGATIYCTLEPCITCAKLIVMSGIVRVVYEYAYDSPIPERDQYWKDVLLSSHTDVEQFIIDGDTIACAVRFLGPDTSKRRL